MAGEGTKKISAYRNANNGKVPKLTVFDHPEIVKSLQTAGITHCAKVPAILENKDVFKENKVGLDTVVVFAPDGKPLFKLSGYQLTQSNFKKLLDQFKTYYESYQKKNSIAG